MPPLLLREGLLIEPKVASSLHRLSRNFQVHTETRANAIVVGRIQTWPRARSSHMAIKGQVRPTKHSWGYKHDGCASQGKPALYPRPPSSLFTTFPGLCQFHQMLQRQLWEAASVLLPTTSPGTGPSSPLGRALRATVWPGLGDTPFSVNST